MKPVLTPRELGDAIGVSESSIKRWVDGGVIAATRTAGGHRRISASEAVRFIRDRQAVLVRPEVLGIRELAGLRDGDSPASADEGDVMFELLKEGKEADFGGYLVSLYLGGRSVAQIIDGPLRTAMARIGELWVNEESGVFWEHRATSICIHAMTRLRMLFSPAENAPVAVGGAPSKDPYILPSLAAATVLQSEGFEAVNLGADTPIDTLILAADRMSARIIWLSVSVIERPEELSRDLTRLLRLAQRRNSTLIIGGCRSEGLKLPSDTHLHAGSSMAELEALAKGFKLGEPAVEERRAG